MDFIAEHNYTVTFANLSYRKKLFFCPYSSDRIMRITEDEQFYIVIRNLFLEIIEIHEILSIDINDQFIHNKLSVVLTNNVPERIIYRFLNDYRIGRLCYRANCVGNRETHAGGLYMPFLKHIKTMMSFHPSGNRIKESVFRLRIGISVDIVLCKFTQCVLDIRGCSEIHIRHPKRKHIFRISAFFGKIIFQAFGISSFNDLIKIQVSFGHAYYLCFCIFPFILSQRSGCSQMHSPNPQ